MLQSLLFTGMKFNIDENWVTITDGKGSYSPIAPQVVDALVATGYRSATDHQMWTPTKKSRKYMTEKRLTFDSLPIPGPLYEGEGGAHDLNCLLWSGKFHHRHWGSEQSVARAQGFVNMSAESLVDLLMDSRRIGEYNKTTKGRLDEYMLSSCNENCPFSGTKKKKLTGVVIQGTKVVDGCAFMEDKDNGYGSEGEGTSSSSRRRQHISKYVGTTKVVRTKNKLPLVRKPLEFISLLNCRELTEEQGGNGYIIVGRSITPAEDDDKKSVIRSEMLLSVIIIRRLHENNKGNTRNTVTVSDSGRVAPRRDLRNRCLMITLSHIKSPLIPKVLSKQVGLSAAKSFMMDIRGCK